MRESTWVSTHGHRAAARASIGALVPTVFHVYSTSFRAARGKPRRAAPSGAGSGVGTVYVQKEVSSVSFMIMSCVQYSGCQVCCVQS